MERRLRKAIYKETEHIELRLEQEGANYYLIVRFYDPITGYLVNTVYRKYASEQQASNKFDYYKTKLNLTLNDVS
jgi:hypothetical protein